MKKFPIIIILLLASFGVSASHKGKVFLDDNKNGVYDTGDRLLKGVMVSDGLNVVKSDEQGEFELPGHPRERFITVTTPSGYRPGTVHYIAIGEGRESYDFPLYAWTTRVDAQGNHKFIHITDTEIHDKSDEERWADKIRDYAANEDVAFIIHTGDICREEGMKKHIALMNSENMGCPVYYCIGNHDMLKVGDYPEQLFEELFGPEWYSFDYGNVHYVVTPMFAGDNAPGYRESEVLEWLENDLAQIDRQTPVISFSHDLETYSVGIAGFGENNLKAWVYGHRHTNFIRFEGGVKTICTCPPDFGGVDHSTTAFRAVSVDPRGETATQLQYADIEHSIAIAATGEQLLVNCYKTASPVISVNYTIADEDEELIDTLAMTQNSDWNWSAEPDIPAKYAGRQLTVRATAQCGDGNSFSAQQSFVHSPRRQPKIRLGSDWPTLLGNAEHNGYDPNPFAAAHMIWASNIGANIFMSSPVIYNNMIYVAAVDEELRGEGGIYALDARSGRLKWSFNTRNSVKNTIAVFDGNVFAQDAEGYLYAVDAATGKLSWERHLEMESPLVLDDGLTVRDGVVYAGSGDGFAAYDCATGALKWKNSEWPRSWGVTSTVAANDDVVIGNAQWSGMYAHDARSGKLLWSHTGNEFFYRASSPALHGGSACFLSTNTLVIVDAATGKMIRSKQLPYSVDVTSTPLVTDRSIVFGTVDNGLVALDRETLEEQWRVETGMAMVYTAPYSHYPATTIETSPVRFGDHVIFGASDGWIYAADLETGKVEWRHRTGAPVFSSAAVSGHSFFLSDLSGTVYAFSCP